MLSLAPRRYWLYLRIVVLSGAMALAGCQSQTKKELAPVKGKVFVGETAAEGVLITFHPDGAKGNTAGVMPIGKVSKDGTYELVSGANPGAPLGWYRVTLTNFGAPGARFPSINLRYTRLDSTPLSVEVVSQPQADQYDLRLNE